MLPNWIGDVVMATPTLRALRTHFGPEVRMIGVVRSYTAEVLAGTNWLDELVTVDRRANSGKPHWHNTVRRLRQQSIDQMVLLPNSFSSALIAWLSGARSRVGFCRYGRSWLLTQRLSFQRENGKIRPRSAVDHYLDLAHAVGCEEKSHNLELATTDESEEHASQIWKRLRLVCDKQIVVINPGGAYGSAKHWPVSHFAELAHRVASQQNAKVLVLCGPSERSDARQIARDADHSNVVSLADEHVSISLSKACVRRADLMITTDSGPRHFAAAFGIPTVTLFGPTDPRWSHNYNPREIVLSQQLPCAPCAKRVCPLGHHKCMRELHVDLVYKAVRRSEPFTSSIKNVLASDAAHA